MLSGVRLRLTAGKSQYAEVSGVHSGKCCDKICRGNSVRDIDSQRGHSEHCCVQIIQIAPVTVVIVVQMIWLMIVIPVAEPDPVNSIGHITAFCHDDTVIVMIQRFLRFILGAGSVSHHHILSQGTMSVTAENSRGGFSGRMVGIIHQQCRGNVLGNIDDPALFAQGPVFPFGDQFRFRCNPFRKNSVRGLAIRLRRVIVNTGFPGSGDGRRISCLN